jgi:hypothetical protein
MLWAMTMQQNPYAPPKASLTDPGPVHPLSPEQEGEAVKAFGLRRMRAKGWAFGIGWLVCTPLLLLVTGFVVALLLGAGLGAGIASLYVKTRRQAMVDAVCRDLGLHPQAFSPDRYLVD